ncbi:MAG: PepSY domain-containing protein [Candidatus Brocadia sp.]|nr:PepSY domain-containing protein [Candidatus Brocadia sp.]
MKNKSVTTIFLTFGLLLSPLAIVLADEKPPRGSKPLSVIIKSVEEQELGSISECEFDDGRWEVKVCAIDGCKKLYINPKSGKEMRRKSTHADEMPPENALVLSTIIESVEARKLGTITEVEYDDGFWDFELLKRGQDVELIIDPMTGEERS